MGYQMERPELLRRTAAGLIAAAGAFEGGRAATPCDRFALHGVSPGMAFAEVASKLGSEGVLTQVRKGGEPPVSAAEFTVAAAPVYVELDARIKGKSAARVVLVRAGFAPSPESLRALADRLGPPSSGADALAQGLQEGAAVWIDASCGVALSAYRRQGSWWTGEVGAYLQLESLDLVRKGGSPASAAVATATTAGVAGGIAALATPTPLPTPPDASLTIAAEVPATGASAVAPPTSPADPSLVAAAGAVPVAGAAAENESSDPPTELPTISASVPERIRYVAPIYPPNLKLMGVKGSVQVSVVVLPDGTVGGVRVITAQPAGRGFEDAAMTAVRRWLYRPAPDGGGGLSSEIPVTIEFR